MFEFVVRLNMMNNMFHVSCRGTLIMKSEVSYLISFTALCPFMFLIPLM